MDYEKLYKETIDKLRKLHNDWDSTQNRAAKEIESVFPELRESEDEKIRKALLEHFGTYHSGSSITNDVVVEDVITWLERKCEKTEPIEGFNTEFERQISHLIASIINKEYEYTEDFVKWTSDALLNYAKHELETE